MVGWSDIVRWSPDALETAYDAFHRNEGEVQAAGDELYRAAGAVQNQGQSATAARGQLKMLQQDADKIEALISDLLSATRVAATGVGEVQRDVKQAQAYADAERLQISVDGMVSLQAQVYTEARKQYEERFWSGDEPYSDLQLEIVPSYRRALGARAGLERSISDIIKKANDIDRMYSAALTAISEGEASASSTAASAGSSADGVDTAALLDQLKNADSPSEVRAFWDVLSDEQQQALIAADPVEIGAMNGVPFQDRFKANDLNIDREVRELDDEIRLLQVQRDKVGGGLWHLGERSDDGATRELFDELIRKLQDRRDYFMSLKSSENGGAVLFDPDSNRIIEAKGDFNKPAAEAVTFVSGTGAKLDTVRDYSGMPGYLVDEGERRGKNTVAFNFYDGRFEGDGAWIGWFGGRSNRNQEHLQQLGANLSEFQDALALEDVSRGADNNVIGYSAGNSVVSASEVASKYRDGAANAHYDHVHSLSGSYPPDGWEQQHGTEYDHYAYKGDMIHGLDFVGFATTLPNSSDVWERHVRDSNEIPSGEIKGPLSKHLRTPSINVDDNLPILQDLSHEIFKD